MVLFNMCMRPRGMEEMLKRGPPVSGPQPLPKHIFNYHKCTNGELRTFLQDRKLDARFRIREQAVDRLQEADRATAFRFLDLPAELRNNVYRVLLTLEVMPHMMGPAQLGTERRCSPEILATSKQVHGEAREILYGENEFIVNFGVEAAPHKPGRYQLECEVCGLRPSRWDGMYMMGVGEPMSLQKQSLGWPDYIRRAEKLTIKIDLPVPPRGVPVRDLVQVGNSTFIALNRALYDMACFLLTKSDPKEIEFDISCEIDKIMKHYNLATILSPIRLFPGTKTFKLRHLAPSVADSIKNPIDWEVHITGEYTVSHVFRKLVRETALYEEMSALTKTHLGLDMKRVCKYRGGGRSALGLGDRLNEPKTHRELLEAVRELSVALVSGGVPVYEGKDQEVAEKLVELKAIRKMFGR